MPSKNLTDRFLAGAPDPGNYFDTTVKGLTLRVTAAGGKLWAFVYRVQGRGPQWIRLGSYPATTLAEARDKARPLRQAVDDKRDPIAERKAAEAAAQAPPAPAAPVMTCRKFAPTFIAFQKGRKKTWRDDQTKLENTILPVWGELPIRSITRTMIAELLTDIAEDAPIGVNRYQAVITRFFAVAGNRGLLGPDGLNPAARMFKLADEKNRGRTRTLTDDEIRTLRAELDLIPSEAADAMRLRLILGQRAEETNGAEWREIKLHERTWFLDGVRTKNGLEQLLWLPDMALEIFQRRRDAAATNATHVFPTLADRQLLQEERDVYAIAGKFHNFVWKDLRRTFSTRLGDLGFDDGVIDRLLNHKAATVGRKHYNHAKYLPEKQIALAAWDRELTRILANAPKTSTVIPMPAR